MLRGEDVVPLNIDPSAPSLENIEVPAPVVFSPAAGCKIIPLVHQSVQRFGNIYILLH